MSTRTRPLHQLARQPLAVAGLGDAQFAHHLARGAEAGEKLLHRVLRVGLASDHLRVINALSLTDRELNQGLAAAGILVVKVQPGSPNMEDVFMSLQ